jgi:hypothetical protein
MTETIALRPAAQVMRPERAVVSVANALSFPRAIMGDMVRDRYQIEKLRFELDAQGKGEVLYRITCADWVFHFFLIADLLPEDAKTDRNFAQGWDAMGVLCQGEWTPEREALLRREVPKQRSGYADYDTLMYARGNRSARVFDHVVQSLAAGRQPDPQVLAPVGYILRTTAFIGNGQLGTRPLAGYEPGHPLRRPYHAQFCSAFALREYVFDLADHLARSRNPSAARLSPAMRRFIGLGNSAATGLAAFLANHPHFVHQWTAAVEQAYAQAKAKPICAQDPVVERCLAWLDKAVRYYEEGAKESDGVFLVPQTLASELSRVRERLNAYRLGGENSDANAWTTWQALCDWAHENVYAEAQEVLLAILLELYPDIVDAHKDAFQADDRMEVQATMSASELLALIERDYGWVFEQSNDVSSMHHFWYRCSSAPRDVRRALRGRIPAYEVETNMDAVLQVQRLREHLQSIPGESSLALVLCERPDLRHIVARVQSLAGMEYAEIRQQFLAADFSPFAAIRFILTFYGMEKFEAAMPKSVRGTFMQGAPIAEDVARGRDAEWPFPLMPDFSTESIGLSESESYLDPLPVSTPPDPQRKPAPAAQPTDIFRIAPPELARMVQVAMQGHGMALGVAEETSGLVAFAQACGDCAVQKQLDAFEQGLISPAAVDRLQLSHLAGGDQSCSVLDAQGAAGIACAAQAHDLATVQALTSDKGVGLVAVREARQGGMMQELVLRAASKGLVGLLLWQEQGTETSPQSTGYALAGPEGSSAWFACGTLDGAIAVYMQLMDGQASSAVDILGSGSAQEQADALTDAMRSLTERQSLAPGYVLIYFKPGNETASSLISNALAEFGPAIHWRGSELDERRENWLRKGITITRAQFDALAQAGNTLLVPELDEPRLLPEGINPLKTF